MIQSTILFQSTDLTEFNKFTEINYREIELWFWSTFKSQQLNSYNSPFL